MGQTFTLPIEFAQVFKIIQANFSKMVDWYSWASSVGDTDVQGRDYLVSIQELLTISSGSIVLLTIFEFNVKKFIFGERLRRIE